MCEDLLEQPSFHVLAYGQAQDRQNRGSDVVDVGLDPDALANHRSGGDQDPVDVVLARLAHRDEALGLLDAKLDDYRKSSYAELTSRIGTNQVVEVAGPSGAEYQIEIQVMWDHKPNGDIRVMGAIDDGGLRAFMPLCSDLIVKSD